MQPPMDTLWHILGLALLFSVSAVGLVALVLGLPGTWIIVAAALVYAWSTDFAAVQGSTLGWLVLLAAVAEVAELVSASAAAAGTRPSTRVTVTVLLCGFVGGLVGTPFFFGVGSLLGALAGAFAGGALAVKWEGGSAGEALQTGWAAFRGRLLGFVLKAAFAVAMVVVLAAAVF